MPKYLHIHVPKHCEQQWEQMQPSAGGNFCSSCEKTVIDFTGFSDQQLMEYFKDRASGVCGRFNTNQLEQALPIPVKKIPWLTYFFRIAIPAMLVSYKAQAQKLIRSNSEQVVLPGKKALESSLRTYITVNGNIIGDADQPVPGASIMIAGTSKGVAADSNGRFSISLAETERLLEISSVGYENKLFTVTDINPNIQLTVPLADNVVIASSFVSRTCRITMGGAIASTSIRTIKNDSIANKIITDNPVSVFPNPVKRGGVITVRWKTPFINKQQLILYNASGSKLMEKTIEAKQSSLQEQVQLNNYAAGYYIISVTDRKTKQQQSATFIIF